MTLALILFLFPLAYSPGPGNMVFAAIGARLGVAASLAPSLGYHIATWVVTLTIGLGFASVARVAPAAFAVIGYAGGVYVLWLAWRFWRTGRLGATAAAPKTGLVDGAVLLLLNPKGYVIIAAMFTQFLPSDPPLALLIYITTVFTLNNFVAFAVWTWAGDVLLKRFRDPLHARLLNRIFAVLLAWVAVWMAIRV